MATTSTSCARRWIDPSVFGKAKRETHHVAA
jgi:hypothetical protein